MNSAATRLRTALTGGWRYGVVVCLIAASASASLFAPTISGAVEQTSRGSSTSAGPSIQSLIAITENATPLAATPDAALAANAALPVVAGALQAANPFGLPGWVDMSTAERAQQCLTLAMYYEAGFEGADGRRAVAQVVLNRVRHPAFPHDVCAVVFQRSAGSVCQFTFACDGAMQRGRDPLLWRETYREAGEALHGKVFAPVGMATHYHANYVFPYWAPRLEKIAVIGHHVFYRWPNGWGHRAVFTAAYDGREQLPLTPETTPTEDIAVPVQVPEPLKEFAREPAPAHIASDAGYVDTSKGWIPRISLPPGGDVGSSEAASPPKG